MRGESQPRMETGLWREEWMMNEPLTMEWCPHCDTEVEIPATMDGHTCPACGKRLLPCSHCRETYPKYSCVLCPLEDER